MPEAVLTIGYLKLYFNNNAQWVLSGYLCV